MIQWTEESEDYDHKRFGTGKADYSTGKNEFAYGRGDAEVKS